MSRSLAIYLFLTLFVVLAGWLVLFMGLFVFGWGATRRKKRDKRCNYLTKFANVCVRAPHLCVITLPIKSGIRDIMEQ